MPRNTFHLTVFHGTTWGLYRILYLPHFLCVSSLPWFTAQNQRKCFTSFGWYLRTLLVFTSRQKIQNCSLLWLDSHCHCNTLTFMYGQYMPLAQNLNHISNMAGHLSLWPGPFITHWLPQLSGLAFRHRGREAGLVYWKISLFSTNWKCRHHSPRHSLCGAWRREAGLTR